MVASKRTSSPGLLCGHWHLCCQAGPSVAVRCNRLSPPCRMLSSRQHVSSCSPCGQDQKVAMRVCFAPSPGCHKRDLPPPNQLCDVDTPYELQRWVRTGWGERASHSVTQPALAESRAERTGEAQGSRRWGPAECSACRNARVLETLPQGCSTGPTPAGASLGKTRQG